MNCAEKMKIGLVDIDGHAKKKKWGATIYPNLALCKIARYHKQHGDDVEWAFPFEHYDVVYMSKVFNFSPDDPQAFAFFQLVEAWRNKWHQYFAYRRDAKSDKRVLQMMRNQCFAYEREIDKYVTNAIGL